jgi:hypothetical protein
MLTRAGIVCDWIETLCKVPEGAQVGEWMLTLPFQRSFIYEVYNGKGGCTPEKEEEALQTLILRRDVPAIKLAVQVAGEQEGRLEQFQKAHAHGRSFWRIGTLASLICQSPKLELRPDQYAPCHVLFEDDPREGEEDAAALVRKLVAADVSRFHPDPAAAYQKATGKALF